MLDRYHEAATGVNRIDWERRARRHARPWELDRLTRALLYPEPGRSPYATGAPDALPEG